MEANSIASTVFCPFEVSHQIQPLLQEQVFPWVSAPVLKDAYRSPASLLTVYTVMFAILLYWTFESKFMKVWIVYLLFLYCIFQLYYWNFIAITKLLMFISSLSFNAIFFFNRSIIIGNIS